ncbi:MAG: hypothetical protein A3J30_01085 [Candidatus Wildermuthbacteria bacterium RIFCSPLOWO2_02_FULL_47_9c]|uniref:3D domain-containing protein n=2 Tax=Parcubacteria group TaxID=1794811 RepID=A0A837IPL5_9BACT|nr:MAG: hypothetical protein UY25_C0001G0142 [Candidatus Yanofskybacteria bacterium GW2011_GWC1_48_11]KKW03883.1 MAG: hypothetical protein UY38_C0002G0037 [Parcubacteria group bacterium GW2011_GWB1_49_12]KKW08555.1 MAG: hypothetical protein UY45_C0006G0041 [Parcubacteria group bacterium GW2011_GWA1_49_26]KKW14033.1 MAG: hypothetical protein UY53_C0004G0084 [Parcubacteria group bacterium GW2011_GWA2_50_10]OHA61274.1 MAG: hypothetical protein A2109_03335 [Candidatus Wildermuthbacteria bacterium G
MKHLHNTVLTAVMVPMLGIVPTLGASTQKPDEDPSSIEERLVLTQANTLLPVSSPLGPQRIVNTMRVVVTAYSSTPEQTDGTPFTTASGKKVRDGIVAANMLPLGTKIKIPALFGDKIFVVEDRMHPKNYGKVDIWFPSRQEAKIFGVKQTSIVVLES